MCITNRTKSECWDYISDSIKAAVTIAKRAVLESGEQVYIAADIGPIPQREEEDREQEEYERMIDLFLELGIRIFVMETFSDVEPVKKMAAYIKAKEPEAFVLGQFSIQPTGYSQMGKSVEHIFADVGACRELDACG